jgi:hypothetical protein
VFSGANPCAPAGCKHADRKKTCRRTSDKFVEALDTKNIVYVLGHNEARANQCNDSGCQSSGTYIRGVR